MGLYLRDLPDITLGDVAEELNTSSQEWGGVTTEVNVRLEGNRLSLAFGDHEVPATADGLGQLATFTDIPRPFMADLPLDMQRYLLGEMLTRNPANVGFRFDDGGINEVYVPGKARIEPRQIADVALRTMGADAQIVEWYATPDDLLFDIMVPDGYDRGIGGDPEVGDTSRGGVRFYQDRKNNHSPNVSPFIYRLICTNGMVVPDSGLKLDARGHSVEDVLGELEEMAERAFSQVEEHIAHFYAMRDQVVQEDVTQAVLRIASEQGLPDRTALNLSRRVPDLLNPDTLGHAVSMFDITNLITNQANDPRIRSRRGPRRTLEAAGGNLVRATRDRCGRCHQVVA